MPVEQLTAFIKILPELEIALREKGETVPRPDYSASAKQEDEAASEQSETMGETDTSEQSKRNDEAASEDEE